MDWCVMAKVGTSPKPLQLEKPKPATVDKLSSKDTNKTSQEIQQLSRLRNPFGLNFSCRAAPSGPVWERFDLLGNRTKVPPEDICV